MACRPGIEHQPLSPARPGLLEPSPQSSGERNAWGSLADAPGECRRLQAANDPSLAGACQRSHVARSGLLCRRGRDVRQRGAGAMFSAMNGPLRESAVSPIGTFPGRGAGETDRRCDGARRAVRSASDDMAKLTLDPGGSDRPVALPRSANDGFALPEIMRSTLRSVWAAGQWPADPETLDEPECRPRRTSIER